MSVIPDTTIDYAVRSIALPAARRVQGLAPGVYQYLPEFHRLMKRLEGDHGPELAGGALNQDFVKRAAIPDTCRQCVMQNR